MARYIDELIAAEISEATRFFDRVIQWRPSAIAGENRGALLGRVFCETKQTIQKGEDFPDLSTEATRRTAILINGDFNHHYDIQAMLMEIHARLSRTSRIIAVMYNPYLAWVYRLANRLGLRKGEEPTTFITRTDIENIARISDYRIVRMRPTVYFPWRLLGLGCLINAILPAIPLLRWLSLTTIATFQPVLRTAGRTAQRNPSLSIVIPARNEKGNIENALTRMPDLGCDLEILFIEGHSKDGTWEEIQRVAAAYRDRFKIKCFQQTGKGKSDAVRLGFSHATHDVLTILDADLTMPPELLGRFYDAYRDGQADFINGTRLVYPMEGEAMRFLNHLGNKFFAKALSTVLDVRIGDSLCGTKLFARHDYARMIRWRERFGDFDPFGDFEMIFPAASLSLGIVDIPIRYRARTYGSTNISRFRHGLLLLKMTLIGFFKIKLGRCKVG